MKISVDKKKCSSQQRCLHLYPSLFEEGEHGKARVRIDVKVLTEDDEIDAQAAANACPSGAIEIEY